MAEIMLLLVFCLLIAAAVIFKEDRRVRDELRTQLTQRDAELADARDDARRQTAEAVRLKRLVVESGRSPAERRQLDEEWQRLVASDEVVSRMREAGLSPERLVTSAADVATVQPLLERGVTGEEIAQAVTASQALADAVSAQGSVSTLSPAELVRLAGLGQAAERSGKGEHDWPPIINLSEAAGYSFAVGSADLTPEFAERLRSKIAEEVVKIMGRYDAGVVEVIGHTDEQAMGKRESNLDRDLIPVLSGKTDIGTLSPADNAGLGMARAVSVARLFRTDPRFSNVTVIPLSGGQMVLPGDAVSDGSSARDARERRRIEIRVRRPEQPTQP
ncbi:hypothetical protein [Aureimonas phyllosphaerae]|uniref:Flagellar motor protein MotB n=2 Tax=Aureimonas phyllosphaerae TaxID=1166078 RepID=A0A7W6FVM4_9HYPH|nr:hypothetical protein [Aureimonas phyllosphaerae]MBB3937353.1 flagellar motor protein MotB [Aureimonas phyllosphaerae]MBB3961360.1 flagellar motor protein MotB [Aureimonas phyllosphaerae]